MRPVHRIWQTLPLSQKKQTKGNSARIPTEAEPATVGRGLRLLEEPTRALTPDGKARMTVYVDVSDVDALYARFAASLAKLSPERVELLSDKPYRQREFQVRMPDGDWLTFGEPVG